MNNNAIKIPNHVAIILDGNGRWATSRGMTRSEGHKHGFENLKKLNEYVFQRGVKVFSVYAFSTENFKRSEEEVNYLMNLFTTKFKTEAKFYQKRNIKVIFSGRKEPLKNEVWETMQKITEMTAQNTGGIFNICLNYGGHTELIDAAKKIALDVQENKLDLNTLNEETYQKYLYHDLPPIDFLIRTSGEMRVSNFMLWQLSYAEFYFPETHFPDFNEKEFEKALIEYTKRDRRFGGINYENQNH